MSQNQDRMFRDEAEVLALAGKGGDGCSSFHREKYVQQGGPDGGDGGRGGSVVFIADPQENSLFRLARRYRLPAENGQPGGGNNCTGRSGQDLEVIVPVGTQVYDATHGHLLADLTEAEERLVVAEGGKGGRGNARFASARQQAPTRADKGAPGEERLLRLELKLVADVGLAGLPNAGKSTMLARLTAARPRVAEYPFTTLDAAEGKGLGHRFLRHVERTRVLLHLVDVSGLAEDPIEAERVVAGEIARYGGQLADRPRLVVATKVEDEESRERAAALFAALDRPPLCVSAATGEGLEAMLEAVDRLLAEAEAT
ncbi:MAG: Obg family GTPase [Planctomycetota bacterium]|jgi:GTP-binding protein